MAFELTRERLEPYLIYQNESIDKLTINRPFQRLYNRIDALSELAERLTLVYATDVDYGVVRYNPLSSYSYDAPSGDATEDEIQNYYSRALTIRNLCTFGSDITQDAKNSQFYALSSSDYDIGESRFFLKSQFSDLNFNFMPNGNLAVNGTLDLGLNDVLLTFGEGAASGDVLTPRELSGYETHIDVTQDDIQNIKDYIETNAENVGYEGVSDGIWNLSGFSGTELHHTFDSRVRATLKHHRCDWTSYSSYNQSYVELHYAMTIDVAGLYDKYGVDEYDAYVREDGSPRSECRDAIRNRSAEITHSKPVFKQKPVIMMQVGFYNNESRIQPMFGLNDDLYRRTHSEETTAWVGQDFQEYNTFTETALTEVDDNGYSISPMNGMVLLKGYRNVYDGGGNIVSNQIDFDVVMKFMVGSASDPLMVDGLQKLNAKAKLQFALIGV